MKKVVVCLSEVLARYSLFPHESRQSSNEGVLGSTLQDYIASNLTKAFRIGVLRLSAVVSIPHTSGNNQSKSGYDLMK